MSQATIGDNIGLDLIATKALNLQRQYNRIKAQLEDQKQALRDSVPEFPHTITIESDGKVLVKSPPQEKITTEAKFHMEKWDQLPDHVKNTLLETGAVEFRDKKTGGGLASVEIKPNV